MMISRGYSLWTIGSRKLFLRNWGFLKASSYRNGFTGSSLSAFSPFRMKSASEKAGGPLYNIIQVGAGPWILSFLMMLTIFHLRVKREFLDALTRSSTRALISCWIPVARLLPYTQPLRSPLVRTHHSSLRHSEESVFTRISLSKSKEARISTEVKTCFSLLNTFYTSLD